MKAIVAFTLITFAFGTMAQSFSPLMGNFKVIGAKCSGESFLWKKHDKVVLSGDVLAIGGVFEKIDSEENEECRFQDIYRRVKQSSSFTNGDAREVSVLLPQFRRVGCWKTANGERVGEATMAESKVETPLPMVEINKVGSRFEITIEERDLCDSEVKLELTHNAQ